MRPFFLSFLSFFLSFFRSFSSFRASPFIREGACTVDGERQRSAEAVCFERKREIFLPFLFFFLQKRALYYLFIKSIHIAQK